MNIVCPHCDVVNKIEYGNNIHCCECKKNFLGNTYGKLKKPLISATAALVIGAFGGYKVDQYISDTSRYPLVIEYEVINSCAYGSKVAIRTNAQVEKTKACLCALDKTMQQVSYKAIKAKGESEFQTRFKENIISCR